MSRSRPSDGQYVAQEAVDAHAHREFALPGLHVNVAGALGDGALDDGVHQADGGGLADGILAHLVSGEGGVHRGGAFAADGGFALHFLDGLGRALVAVEHLYGALHCRGHGHHGHDLSAGGLADFLDGVEVERVAHGEVELVLLHGHGYDLVLLGDILRHDGGQLRRDIDFAEVYVFDAQLHLQGFDQLILGNDAVGDQHLAQTALLRFLQSKAAIKVFLCDRTCGKQKLTETTVKSHSAFLPTLVTNWLLVL